MSSSKEIPLEHNLQILELIGQNPQTTQLELAARLGVAVGTVNWYLHRLIGRGCIKVRRLQRRRLLYLITPRGITEKSRLGFRYANASLKLYHETRRRAIELLTQVRDAGYDHVSISGDGDLAEICRLTSLDQGIQISQSAEREMYPLIEIDGVHIQLSMPDRRSAHSNQGLNRAIPFSDATFCDEPPGTT